MIFLENGGLTVSVLDPVLDRNKLGSRYCAGGYIWQVEDAELGPLLSGPFYPGATTGFDGQGAPEVFEIALGSDAAKTGDEVCVLGVGMVRRESRVKPFHVRDNPTVSHFADWDIDSEPDEVVMRVSQTFRDYGAHILRRVRLRDRELESRTEVNNVGERPLPLRWFAHPFFPPVETLCRFSVECSVPSNPAFELDAENFVRRRPDYPWGKGFYQPLQLAFGNPIQVEQRHPKVGIIAVSCDFPLMGLPIWGNARAFSFEPCFHTVVDSGTSASWAVRYRF